MSLPRPSRTWLLAAVECAVVVCAVAATLGMGSLSGGRDTAEAILAPRAVATTSGASATVGTRSAATPATPSSETSGPVDFHYDLHTFRGEDEGTAVVAAVAVPVSELHGERRDGATRYRFDVRFVLADTAEKSVVDRIDSVYVSSQWPMSRGHLIHTVVELDAPPSTGTQQRIVVTDVQRPGYGQLQQSDFPIPDYSGTSLMVSDIAFGLPGVPGGWTRRGVSLALLPTSQFPESEFDLYYEIYNLPPGRSYQTEIAVASADDPEDDDEVVRAVFEGESAAGEDGIIGELRRVASALDDGRYRITVTVTDREDGRVATSSRTVEVHGWGRGATMVRALPKRGDVDDGG